MSDTDIRRNIEIAIGRIQFEEEGQADLRASVLQFLRFLLNQIDAGKVTPETANESAATAIYLLKNGKIRPMQAEHAKEPA